MNGQNRSRHGGWQFCGVGAGTTCHGTVCLLRYGLVPCARAYTQDRHAVSVEDLHRELLALGGCESARVTTAHVVVHLARPLGPAADRPAARDPDSLSPQGKDTVCVHGPAGVGAHPPPQGPYRFSRVLGPASGAGTPGDGGGGLWGELQASLVPWLLSGFSAVVVGYAQVRHRGRWRWGRAALVGWGWW
jgi:hypothetical protein